MQPRLGHSTGAFRRPSTCVSSKPRTLMVALRSFICPCPFVWLCDASIRNRAGWL